MCTIMPMFSLQSENSMYQMSCPVCYWYIHIYICQLTESDRRSVNASASAAASDVCVYQILYFNALKPLSWTIVLVSLSVDVYCSHTDLFLLLLELCVLVYLVLLLCIVYIWFFSVFPFVSKSEHIIHICIKLQTKNFVRFICVCEFWFFAWYMNRMSLIKLN